MNTKSKNVLISIDFMKRIIYLLEHIDISEYDTVIKIEHTTILFALNKKEEEIYKRELYSKMVYAENESERDDARIEYLRYKEGLRRGRV